MKYAYVALAAVILAVLIFLGGLWMGSRANAEAVSNAEIHEKVKRYYSELTNLKGGELASAVCSCASAGIPEPVKRIVAELPDEIVMRYYGCGSPIPWSAGR